STDGCSSTCQVEIGWQCPTPGAACTKTTCGDSLVQGAEQCDDGNVKNTDGCNSTCQLEAGFYCPTPGAACLPTVCGDGKMQGLEACDDGNTANDDGCSSTCTVEGLYVCTGTTPSVCKPVAKWVQVRTFDVNNVNPVGVVYDPRSRSFVGYKQSLSAK